MDEGLFVVLLLVGLVVVVWLWWANWCLSSPSGEWFASRPEPRPYRPQQEHEERSKWLPTIIPVEPSRPRLFRNMGQHANPLAESGTETCQGDFERLDERTWQCVECHLLHFEKAS